MGPVPGRRDLMAPAALAAATALAHIATAADTYGIFRDELYYLACAEHLDFGYVDHPPLIALIAWLARSLLGESLVALRTLPALAAGGTVFLTCLMARDLGGSRLAQSLAGIAAALAPVYVSIFGILSMNAFDVLLWTAGTLVLIRILGTGSGRLWPAFGLLAGIGLLNKISVLFLGAGVVLGLAITPGRRHMMSPRFWMAGGVALALFAPHVIWQAAHGWPTLEFMANATREKNLPLSPLDFLSAQAEMMNPVALPLFLAGLAFYLIAPTGRPYRALGWTFLAITAIMITQRSKAYYLSPAYTMMFAPGAVMACRLAARRGWGWTAPGALAAILISGIAWAPLAKPLLPLDRYVAYAAMLGEEPSTGERKELGRLPQFFADRIGWPELASDTAGVLRSLPEADRRQACIFGQNYGQAGAVDFYGRGLGLAQAISGHNSYHLWGPRDCSGQVVIVIGGSKDRLDRAFEQVEQAATHRCGDCMPYENDKPIWVCRRMKAPLDQVWPEIKHFD